MSRRIQILSFENEELVARFILLTGTSGHSVRPLMGGGIAFVRGDDAFVRTPELPVPEGTEWLLVRAGRSFDWGDSCEEGTELPLIPGDMIISGYVTSNGTYLRHIVQVF